MRFLLFDNLAITSRTTLLFTVNNNVIQNASVRNRIYGYLRLSFISMCVSYVFNILPVKFPLYLLVTTQIQLIKLSLFHDNM